MLRCICILAMALLLTGVGCKPVNLRGNGYGDFTSSWGEKLRPPTNDGQGVGFDRQAQEIERNLGVR